MISLFLGVERVLCKATITGATYLLGVIYRPPNSPIYNLQNVKAYLAQHITKNTRIILSGDINLLNIDWLNYFAGNVDFEHNEESLDLASTLDLSQEIKSFTRVQDTSNSILDLVFIGNSIAKWYLRSGCRNFRPQCCSSIAIERNYQM